MNNYNEDKFNEILKNKAKQENIQVPENLKKDVLKTLNKLPNRKVKRKNKLSKVSGLVAGVIICLLTFNVFMPAYAESLPVIGPTFKEINEAIGIGGKYVEGSKDVDITKKYDDTTMTIKNIYYDGVELAIAYELKSENGFDEKPIIFPIIKSGFKSIQYKNEENDGEFIDDNTYVGLASYTFTENQLSDKAKIEFIVNDLYGSWVGYYPKKFKFKLSIDSKDMGKETYNVNKEIKYDDSNYKVTDIITSKLNTLLYIDTDTATIIDENNPEIFREEYMIRFIVLDDKGSPIKGKGGNLGGSRGNDDRFKGNGNWRFDALPDETKSITLIPIISEEDYSRELIMGKINKNNETNIKLESDGEYIIRDINFEEDRTVMEINVKQYVSALDNLQISIWDEEKVQKYRDSNNGQEENWYNDTQDIEILETKFNGIEDGYNFTLTLPALDKDKDYYFTIMDQGYKILEDQKITVDLSKN